MRKNSEIGRAQRLNLVVKLDMFSGKEPNENFAEHCSGADICQECRDNSSCTGITLLPGMCVSKDLLSFMFRSSTSSLQAR